MPDLCDVDIFMLKRFDWKLQNATETRVNVARGL